MEKANYIKKDVLMIVLACIILCVLFTLLKIYDHQTGQLAIWAQNFYNFFLQK